jgi:hypothetical protein
MAASSLDLDHVTWTHIFTTHEFWTGAFVSGLLSSAITYFSTRDIAARRARHEVDMQDRKDKREDRLREEESLYSVAQEFAQVTTEILTDTVDAKGIFNVLRDMFYNQTGQDDPKASEKFDHSEKVVEAQKRITVPMNKLKLVAPNNVLDAASRLATAVMEVARQTTNPFAGQVARRAAGEELTNFINVFRAEVGKAEYTETAQRDAALNFLHVLQRQSDDFVEESRDAMRAAGFEKTPWDNWKRKTPRTPSPS